MPDDESALHAKIQSLQSYVALYDKVKSENANLKEEVKKKEHEQLQAIAFLQKELEAKNKQIKSLNERLEGAYEEFHDQLRTKELEWNAKRIEAERVRNTEPSPDAEREKARLMRENQELATNLKKKEDEVIQLKSHFDSELNRLKIQFYEEKTNLKQEEEMLRRMLQEEIHLKALGMVNRKSKEIHSENRELRDQSNVMENNLIAIGTIRDSLELENRTLVREKKFLEESVKAHVKQTIKLSKEMKELSTKIVTLEDALTATTNSSEKEKQDLKRTYSSKVEALERHCHELQNNLVSRTKELVHLKKIAERILSQRTELEMFFSEAFGYVKSQKLKEIKAMIPTVDEAIPSFHNPDAFPGREFPPIHHSAVKRKYPSMSPSPTQTSSPFKRTLSPVPLSTTNQSAVLANNSTSNSIIQENNGDFSSLSWEEKERVLKMLFQKINGTTVIQQAKKSPKGDRFSDYPSYQMTRSAIQSKKDNSDIHHTVPLNTPSKELSSLHSSTPHHF